jgi:starch synthase
VIGAAAAPDVNGAPGATGVPAAVRVLLVAAEVYPLVKTGGLGDVIGALPGALARAGADVRLLLPGYPAIAQRLHHATLVALLGPAFGAASIMVRIGRVEGIDVPVYVIDAPALYERPGNPYLDPLGQGWPDNPQRFGLLSWVAAHLGLGDIDRTWRPQVLHAHDWHAALAPAYLRLHPAARCRSVFTVHNLAFHGLFERARLPDLLLPPELFDYQGVEFHGQGSFIKAGLQFADRITTVSPSYAREIQTVEFGCGLEGVIGGRRGVLRGILNGIDTTVWDPTADPLAPAHFDADELAGKAQAKASLQRELGLAIEPGALLLTVVSRLTGQKGIDLLVQAMPALLAEGAQLAVLGSGEAAVETQLQALAATHPQAVGVRFGYDEAFAHRLIAGGDVIAVPSRFEPCGLTQLYGLRYGTLPLVRRVGGLADTVVDADPHALAQDRATGFVFHGADAPSLLAAARRALQLYRQPSRWMMVVRQAMAQNFSWHAAAQSYLQLYQELIEAPFAD